MNLSDCIQGLTILQRYFKRGDGYHLGAEHDVMYVSPTDSPLSNEDVQKMYDLGWFQSGIDHEEGGQYDPEESWKAFV